MTSGRPSEGFPRHGVAIVATNAGEELCTNRRGPRHTPEPFATVARGSNKDALSVGTTRLLQLCVLLALPKYVSKMLRSQNQAPKLVTPTISQFNGSHIAVVFAVLSTWDASGPSS